MVSSSKEKLFSNLLFIVFLVLLASIVFSWRGVTSISLGLILIIGVANTSNKSGRNFLPLYFISCALLFILICIALFYTHNMKEGIAQVQKKSGIVLIPLAMFACSWFLNKERFQQLMNFFSLFLLLACIICLANASVVYFKTGNNTVFFYHDLVKPFHQHAIQFSILLFFDLLYLLECLKSHWIFSKKYLVLLLVFFSIMLVLLSSKLILLVYLVYLFYYFFWQQKKRIRKSIPYLLASLVIVVIAFSTSNPVSQRFRILVSGNRDLFLRDQFEPGVYFNGIQFRLLQWRLTGEILSENKAWVAGVSPGDAQDLLNQKYVQKNMYTGLPGAHQGYWNYHTHNQFLQTCLQNGLIGLATLVVFWLSLVQLVKKSGPPTGQATYKWPDQSSFKAFMIMMFLYCFSDAPFETQYGIILIIFLPLFSYLCHRFNQEILQTPKTLATK